MPKYNGPSFIIEFPLQPNIHDHQKVENLFDISRVFYNRMLDETVKRYHRLTQDKRYAKNERCIKGISKKIRKIEKQIGKETDKKELSQLKKELKEKEQERKTCYVLKNDLMKEFGYMEFILHAVATELNHYYTRLDSNNAQKLATRAFRAVEKMREGKAKCVNFKKYGSMTSIEGKTNKSGITFRKEDDKYVVKLKGICMPVAIKGRDSYAHEAIQDLTKISYCKIVRRIIRGNVRFFVQLTIKGVPPIKKNRKLGKGIVGIDPSLQMMAIVSQYRVILAELAPMVQNLQDEIRLLQRKLDRSRRSTNPKKFNYNGTINRNNKDPWVRSNNYMKIVYQLKELHRKQAAIRKLSHNRLTNLILAMGDVFKIEKNNFRAFQKRKKKTTKKNGKYQSKKRYGKSIASKAPSMFLTLLKNKVTYLGGQYSLIDPRVCKPSQYDHVTNEYKKKTLKERWHVFSNGRKVQRDVYSAFLIQQANETTSEIERIHCIQEFDTFKTLHDIEIERIKKNNQKLTAFGV